MSFCFHLLHSGDSYTNYELNNCCILDIVICCNLHAIVIIDIDFRSTRPSHFCVLLLCSSTLSSTSWTRDWQATVFTCVIANIFVFFLLALLWHLILRPIWLFIFSSHFLLMSAHLSTAKVHRAHCITRVRVANSRAIARISSNPYFARTAHKYISKKQSIVFSSVTFFLLSRNSQCDGGIIWFNTRVKS